jgi:hypothetical protein
VLQPPKETPMSVVMEEEIKRWTARRKSVMTHRFLLRSCG